MPSRFGTLKEIHYTYMTFIVRIPDNPPLYGKAVLHKPAESDEEETPSPLAQLRAHFQAEWWASDARIGVLFQQKDVHYYYSDEHVCYYWKDEIAPDDWRAFDIYINDFEKFKHIAYVPTPTSTSID